MRLPIELLVALPMAAFLQNPALALPANWRAITAAAAVMLGICWLFPRTAWAVLRRRLARDPGRRLEVYESHAAWLAIGRSLSVTLYGLFLWGTDWSALVAAEDGLNAGVTVVGDDILQILPFLAASAALWAGDYPAVRGLHPADWGLGEYLRQQARGWFFLLAPWLVMTALFDSRRYWPWGLDEVFTGNAQAELALTALVFAAALVLFPAYLIRLWPPQRLPGGELRSRLEALLARAGVRCRELVVWRTGRGRLPNAAVMGLIAPLRYVAFTDALLAELAPEEVEAVLAHEAGHVRHRHIGFYALFAAGFMGLGLIVLALFEPLLSGWDPHHAMLAVAATLAAGTVLYWRFAFGFLSRRFERQADAAAFELLGTGAPLVSALERLACIAGAPREAGSWRHYSIAERVAFLERAAADPGLIARHHRHVRAVKLAFAAALAALLALAAVQGAADGWFRTKPAGDQPAEAAAPPVARPRPGS
ncbi:MAG TPA: M48 family metallopeptidase [Planctomycetota bacterium]|nr:M48 family metallopeptidase [Planctomycetota bacterium]